MEHTSNPNSPNSEGGWEVEDKGRETGGLKVRLRASKINKKPPATASSSLQETKKRKKSQTQPPSSKKPKMEDKIDELKLLITSQHTNTRAQIDNAIEPLKGDLQQLKDTTASIAGECEENRAEIKKLQNDMEAFKKTIKDEIKNEIKGELEQAQLAAFKVSVARDIERTAMNLVVHGLRPISMEAFLGLLDTLQIPEKDKIVVKRVTALGKGSNAKTCLVELGDSAQRNAILSSLGPNKVPAGIKIDKDCPPTFREKYKEFKTKAFKYKTFFQVKTQVVFVGHELVLRYKDKDNAYTIIDTFSPTPKKEGPSGNGNKTTGGVAPSSSISPSKVGVAKCCFVFGKEFEKSIEETQKNLEETLGPDISKIKDVKLIGGRVTVRCVDAEAVKVVALRVEEAGTQVLTFI